MNFKILILLLWSTILTWVIFMGLSRKAEAHQIPQSEKGLFRFEYDAGLFHYHSRILTKLHTQFLLYPEEYQGLLEERVLMDSITEINNELGLHAIDVLQGHFSMEICKKSKTKIKNTHQNIICFTNDEIFEPWQESESTLGVADISFPGQWIGGITMTVHPTERKICARIDKFLLDKTGWEVDPDYVISYNEIYKAKVIINISRIQNYEHLKETVKHELLHTLGFGHFRAGVMSPSANGQTDIHPEQLQNWENYINNKGGFHESHVIMSR